MKERILLITLTTFILSAAGLTALTWEEPPPAPNADVHEPTPEATTPETPAPEAPPEATEPPPAAPAPAPPQPHAKQGDTLILEGQLSHAFVKKTADPQRVQLQIDVDGSALKPLKPLPSEVAIVIDRSGSMKGRKLDDARTAALRFVERLGDDDRVAIISYENRARVDLPFTRLGDPGARASVTAAVKKLRAGGGTNIHAALQSARPLFDDARRGPQRLVLLSDGRAEAREACEKVAEAMKAQGIVTTAMGLGLDYDERMLTGIADHGGGNYYFIADAHNLEATFDKELETVNNAVAKEVRVRVQLDPRVRLEQVHGFPYEVLGATFTVSLGTFWSGRNASILAELTLQAELTDTTSIAEVQVDYLDLVRDAPATHVVSLSVAPTTEVAVIDSNLNGEVLVRYEKIENARAYEDAMAEFEVGNQARAQKILDDRNVEIARRKDTVLKNAKYGANKDGLLGGLDADVRQNASDSRSLGNMAPASASGRSFVKSKRAASRDLMQAF